MLSLLWSGVAYITDKNRGNCTAKNIEPGAFDNRMSGPNNVRIRNTKEFFYFDVAKTATSYEGVVGFKNYLVYLNTFGIDILQRRL